ncbi:4-hydroxy-tetrahydrodipicolinate reductase [Gryllotalpicola protaetiae]|uniref:4-hydroxy-tetrahydrodipicolinate reductase n=1 Tax=Gryllotalpicola protaetiae TaxID=2419771 RepID=A0A387BUC5_9MICO|nr:4-hydroxy-tetrahydrodipicolinate reductase [Gryllotalpicola protaetiae]AYG04527.1 4-hydroxy-tetrahydrodipicolinate reductase [Gryllotalpicola protaetiae]
MTIRVAVVGATGKLGSAATALLDQADGFEVVARLGSRSEHAEMLGAADAPSDVVLDVTLPQVSHAIVDYAVTHGRNVVVGTSGWSADRLATLKPLLAAHPERGVVVIPNFSLGSALGTAFAAAASRFFDAIEIVETHGAGKVDSPSGTAVRTAELIQEARGELGPVSAPHIDQRARGQQVGSVPIHSLRLPGVSARQEVTFGAEGETLVIRHDVISSSAYSAGILLALRAATERTGLTVGLDALIDLGAPAER